MGQDRHRHGECACCGREGRLSARGLIGPCTDRYTAADRLGEWPTERELIQEDVQMVLRTGAPYSVAAARSGITERTVNRMVARWRVAGVGLVREAAA